MPSLTTQPDLWSLVRGTASIDPAALLAAIERELHSSAHDFRTRLLIRDALDALRRRWGEARLRSALAPDLQSAAAQICGQPLGEPGFPTLERRMADATDSQTILQFLRELGDTLRSPARIEIGGSCALILADLISRGTDDIDVVDQVPPTVRTEHDLLDRLATRYGLTLTHFQSHYLPAGWASRVRSLGVFGKLTVLLVDPIDIFVGKLFSKREKDLDDLRRLNPSLAHAAIVARLQASAGNLLANSTLRADAERNWYIVFGEPLPA